MVGGGGGGGGGGLSSPGLNAVILLFALFKCILKIADVTYLTLLSDKSIRKHR
jgi:hypothetical protein